MKFLTKNNGDYFFDYNTYFNYLLENNTLLSKKFINKYIENDYFHDYFIVSFKTESYKKGKNRVFITLSKNCNDLSENITLKYDSVENIEYTYESAFLGSYLYGEFSFDGNLIHHEILLDDGQISITFHRIQIL